MASRSAFGREKNNTMPGTSRTQQKAEARYNVTTHFPQYDLHFAAASGNLGLVEFALGHGQPINSVLNGVLPLHAACAGGSEVVVKYLIDEGADVNAPRIPRRYSNEKHKASVLAVGASGSTPLHFAAANGHMGVVKLLLEKGAVPDRADKHGVTPEMLARENGWIECADVLAAWSGGRTGDLPPVQGDESFFGSASGSRNGSSSGLGGMDKDRDGCEIAESIYNSAKRLHMKRSIDNALHLFKAPLALHHHGSYGQLREREHDRTPPSPSAAAHAHAHSFLPFHSHHPQHRSHSHGSSPSHSHLHSLFHHTHSHSTSQLHAQSQSQGLTGAENSGEPPSPSKRPVENTDFNASSGSLDAYGIPSHRRPSLPHIFDQPTSPFQRRLSDRKRRPKSAGSDAEQDTNGSRNGVNGGRIDGSTLPNGSTVSNGVASTTVANNPYPSANTNTIRKLSSKVSFRNLFRSRNETNSSSNISGSEPGSSSVSVSTSFSNTSASPYNPYNHTFSSPRARGTSSPTPPASPLSTSFTPPSTSALNTGGRPGSWYRSRLGSEGAGSVPRSPLVPTAVELHHRYSQGQLSEEFRKEAEPDIEADIDAPSMAPRLTTRPSILRGHNRSASSTSSSGTPGAGPRTLRFEASSASPSPSVSPAPNRIPPIASAVRLRGTRSASSLRHGESFGYDEEEEEEEDYGTSINVRESDKGNALNEEDVEFESPGQELSPPAAPNGYKYGSVGRARGASFTSTSSSSPGISPGNRNAHYEATEFPFSIDLPPPTPSSIASESSVTTLPEGGRGEATGLEDSTDSRIRGESISSAGTEESTAGAHTAQSQNSSRSALTDITTPSPGTQPQMTVLHEEPNEGDVHRARTPSAPAKHTTDAIYLHDSPTSSLDDLSLHEREEVPLKMTPLDLRGISNLAEAEALVKRAQQVILASASLPAEGPESPDVPLSAQLAAYGEILALERRFARGEAQREGWSKPADSDGEEDERTGAARRKPQSAKEAQNTQKRRDAPLRQRGAASGLPGSSGSRFRHKGIGKAPKHKRPHTAEGAPQAASWSVNHPVASPSNSATRADIDSRSLGSHSQHVLSHSRSTSSPLYLGKESGNMADIAIIETTATPVESPKTPEGVTPRFSAATDDRPSMRYTFDDTRPSLPMRSRTPEPDALGSTDDLSFGVPLTRVATAPLQNSNAGTAGYGSYGTGGESMPRTSGGARKLAKMGFSLDAHHNIHGHRHHNHITHSPGSSAGSSRSPSKARFGGIKSLVRGLKGKS